MSSEEVGKCRKSGVRLSNIYDRTISTQASFAQDINIPFSCYGGHGFLEKGEQSS